LAWDKHPYAEIMNTLEGAEMSCWLSGGLAFDLHLGTQTRDLIDVDISILRKDENKLKEIFYNREA